MKKWSIAVLAMAILAAGAVSVSAAVDQTQPISASFVDLTEKAALQGCDGIPDLDGTGNQYQGAGADAATPVDTAGTDTTPSDDCIPDQDGTGNQYGANNSTGNGGNAQNCPNESCPADPDCDGIPDRDGTGNQYGRENGVSNGGNAANCPNENCPADPDCDGVPSYDGTGAQHHGGRGNGNGHCKGQ